jgi:hypothetical protein
MTPKETGLGAYFENTYDVAAEGFERGLPPLILIGYLARTLLVLNACILGALPSQLRDKISGNWLYKFFVRLPLRFCYTTVLLWIREPGMTSISLTSAFVAGLVGFALSLYFWIHSSATWITRAGMIAVATLLIIVSVILINSRRRLGI